MALCAGALLIWPPALRGLASVPAIGPMHPGAIAATRDAASVRGRAAAAEPWHGNEQFPAQGRYFARPGARGRPTASPTARWRWAAPLLARRWIAPLLVALATAIGSVAGVAAACSALLVSCTAAKLASAELRLRRERTELRELRGATATLAREIRAGAGPVRAVLATAAAHPGRPAAILESLAMGVGGTPGLFPLSSSNFSVQRSRGRRSEEGRPGYGAEVADRLTSSWSMSARYGVHWAALIDTVTADLADRESADSRRNAQVAGPRVSGYVLAAMPALGLLLGVGMGADPLRVLIGTGVGSVLLLTGTSLTCLGLLWTASIVRG